MSDKAEDLNVLGAKLIKAELLGDEELVKSIKERLERARQLAAERKEAQPSSSSSHKQQQQPNQQQHSQRHHHHNQSKSHQQHHQQRSFDANRLGDVEADIVKNKKYKHNANDEYDDLGPAKEKNKKHKKFDSRHQQSQNSESTSNRQKEKDIKTSDKCDLCYENAQKHLIVSIGKYCYLRLPSDESLVEGECLIVPINHCKSSITCDEEVLGEIKEFKKALVEMFDARRMECVFVEQYTDNNYSHLNIVCIPLGLNVADMGPIYFKKAILESESEWAQNKSLITMKDQDLRKLIPKNMPYFAVNFGVTEGFAHVIENSEAFPPHFAKEIIGGILDLDPFLWRRPQREDFARQSKKVIEFLKWWKTYDFNKQ